MSTGARDRQRPLAIDFNIIADAQRFYADHDFIDVPVPWVIDDEAYMLTKPEGAEPYRTLGGVLVASGEQSFTQLLLDGVTMGRAQTTTPCFRDEPHDDTHSPYFMKTELIHVGPTDHDLRAMIDMAHAFFTRYLPVRVIDVDDAWDIVTTSGLELGSYGVRRYRGFSWAYGTGVALPRLTQALATG